MKPYKTLFEAHAEYSSTQLWPAGCVRQDPQQVPMLIIGGTSEMLQNSLPGQG